MDQGSSDGVLVCYQKIYSLVRLAKLEPWSISQLVTTVTPTVNGPGVKLVSELQQAYDQLGQKEKNKKQTTSNKRAALTMDHGSRRMNIEREEIYMSMDSENYQTVQLKRIADAIEEILRLVKKDMEPKKK